MLLVTLALFLSLTDYLNGNCMSSLDYDLGLAMPIAECILLFTRVLLPHLGLAGRRDLCSSAPGELVVLFCTHLNNATSTFLEDWARYLEWPPCTVDLRIVLARNSACTFYKHLETVFSLGWARAPLSSYLG